MCAEAKHSTSSGLSFPVWKMGVCCHLLLGIVVGINNIVYVMPLLCIQRYSTTDGIQFSRSVVSDSVQPIDGSPPGSPVPGILQARTLEWVAISFSNSC